jgi:hypothetical protein
MQRMSSSAARVKVVTPGTRSYLVEAFAAVVDRPTARSLLKATRSPTPRRPAEKSVGGGGRQQRQKQGSPPTPLHTRCCSPHMCGEDVAFAVHLQLVLICRRHAYIDDTSAGQVVVVKEET